MEYISGVRLLKHHRDDFEERLAVNRRTFLKTGLRVGYTLPVALGVYGYAQGTDVEICRRELPLAKAPHTFNGMKIAFLTDIHLGPYISEEYVATIVRTTLALQPDLIILGGDYIYSDKKYIRPCFKLLAELEAPLGVYGVLGNHDYVNGIDSIRSALREASIQELTNRSVSLEYQQSTLLLTGVDDFWYGRPNCDRFSQQLQQNIPSILISHNPDFAEYLGEHRPSVVLSGHTHGGQIQALGLFNPFLPSRFGTKYAQGFAQAPTSLVYTSRGLGMSTVPCRLNCPPELTLFTVTAPATDESGTSRT